MSGHYYSLVDLSSSCSLGWREDEASKYPPCGPFLHFVPTCNKRWSHLMVQRAPADPWLYVCSVFGCSCDLQTIASSLRYPPFDTYPVWETWPANDQCTHTPSSLLCTLLRCGWYRQAFLSRTTRSATRSVAVFTNFLSNCRFSYTRLDTMPRNFEVDFLGNEAR